MDLLLSGGEIFLRKDLMTILAEARRMEDSLKRIGSDRAALTLHAVSFLPCSFPASRGGRSLRRKPCTAELLET